MSNVNSVLTSQCRQALAGWSTLDRTYMRKKVFPFLGFATITINKDYFTMYERSDSDIVETSKEYIKC